VDFLGYCRSLRLLHATKPRIHALVTIWQVRVKHTCKKNPSVDFFMIAEAKGFCMLLTRPPWLDISWQVRIKHTCKKNPSVASTHYVPQRIE
jgi:hypothetical protein